MGELHLRVGRSGTGKTQKMLEEIRDYNEKTRHIIIVPDQLSHGIERNLCELCGDNISLRGEVLTFSRLSNHIFHHCGGLEDPELDKGGRLLLLHQSVSKCQGSLEVLNHYAQHGTFYDKLMNTVDELKTNRVATEALFDLDDSIPEQKKIRDIGMICGFYDSFTLGLGEEHQQNLAEKMGVDPSEFQAELVAFDPRDRFSRVADALGDSSWGEDKTFWVDGFTDFTPQQLDILQHLMGQGDKMTLNLIGDLEDEPDGLFAPSFLTMNQLQDRGKRENIEVTVEEIRGDFLLREEPLDYLESELFKDEPQPFQGKFDNQVRIFSALSPRSEVEWVASEILDLVREQGHRFRDILVVARDFSAYRTHIESVFPRYEIPVFTTEMTSILEKPVISVVQTVFQAMNSFYRTEDVLRYLKTGFSNLELDRVDALEDYLLMWDENNWRIPWTKHTKRYDGDISLAGLEEMRANGDPDYEKWKKSYESNLRSLDVLNKYRLRVMKPLLKLEKAVENASGKTQCEAVYAFLEELHLYEKMKERQRILEEEGNLAQSQEYKQLWEILCSALEQCHRLFTNEIMDFKEFSKVFILVLSQYSVGTIPVSLDQVTAGETTRLKSNRSKTVFWLGCEDNTVPLASSSGGLLTDFDRSILSKLQITLNQDSERLLYREMTTAYEICALATEKLYFSYPSRSMTGETLRPCFLIERLRGLFSEIKVEDEEDLQGFFRLSAPIPGLEQNLKFPFVKDLLRDKATWADSVARLESVEQWTRGSLSPLGVTAIYGKEMTLSATAMDKLNGCLFGFFMYYGLGARARRKMEFKGAEYGNLVHHVLEKVLQHHINVTERDKKQELSRQPLHLQEIMDHYLENQLGGRKNKTPRELFLLHRMERYVADVVKEVFEELNRSEFAYLGGEVKFNTTLADLSGEEKDFLLSFQGSIDRVDGYLEENNLYLHLVDYKTGNKPLSYSEILDGRDLQLLLYYLALEKQAESFFPDFATAENQVFPVALSYLPGKTESETGKRDGNSRQDSPTGRVHVRHTGLFLDEDHLIDSLEEPEEGKYRYVPVSRGKEGNLKAVGDSLVTKSELNLLLDCGKAHLMAATDKITSGNISANPYFQDDLKNACLYCDYKSACHFQTEADQQRVIEKLNKFEAINHLKEKGVGNNGTK